MKTTKRDPSQGGYLLAVSVILLLVFAIFAPLLWQLSNANVKRTVRETRSDAALQLAQAGITKALWKLTQLDKSWTTVCEGGVLAGYVDDVEYTDVAGGLYKIRITSSGTPQQVKVVAKGRDALSGETRTIEAVYGQPDAAATQLSGTHPTNEFLFNYNTNNWQYQSTVHWGSIWSFSNISMEEANSCSFPRKFSAGKISGRDSNPQTPNSDEKEYFAYEMLGAPPVIDFDYYEAKAKTSVVPITVGAGKITQTGGADALATPPGSGYFLASQNGGTIDIGKTSGYVLNDPNAVFFLTDDTPNGLYFTEYSPSLLNIEALISTGGTVQSRLLPYGNMGSVIQTTIPVNAPMEYESTAAAAIWTANNPLGSVITKSGVAQYSPGTSFAAVFANPSRCCFPLQNVFVKGFVYLEGEFYSAWNTDHSPPVMVGQFMLNGLMSTSWGNYSIFYDKSTADRVRFFRPFKPERLSWKETRESW